MSNPSYDELLSAAEKALDGHHELTRNRKGSETPQEAELVYSRSGDWTLRCMARNATAKGRGSSYMSPLCGDGETPELALASFIERLDIWAKALR